MQAISPRPQPTRSFAHNLGYFLIPPIIGLTLLVLVLALAMSAYRAQHSGRIYTGVTVQGIDVSEMTVQEATAALAGALPYTAARITLVDPATGQEWGFTPQQLGILVDAEATASAAFAMTNGARDMCSTPPATTRSASPSAIMRPACATASRPEPQRRLTVTPGTEAGIPVSRSAIRATSRLSSPAWFAQP